MRGGRVWCQPNRKTPALVRVSQCRSLRRNGWRTSCLPAQQYTLVLCSHARRFTSPLQQFTARRTPLLGTLANCSHKLPHANPAATLATSPQLHNCLLSLIKSPVNSFSQVAQLTSACSTLLPCVVTHNNARCHARPNHATPAPASPQPRHMLHTLCLHAMCRPIAHHGTAQDRLRLDFTAASPVTDSWLTTQPATLHIPHLVATSTLLSCVVQLSDTLTSLPLQ